MYGMANELKVLRRNSASASSNNDQQATILRAITAWSRDRGMIIMIIMR